MNKKKAAAAGLLCSLWMASMAHMQTVYAATPSLSASADTGSVAAGDYVNVNVELGSNPSISTLGAALGYDSSVLKYDSTQWNSGFSGSDMQMASDTGSEVNLSVVCDNSYSADGTVATVRFQAVKDTDSIPVTLQLRDMADANLAEVGDCDVTSAVYAPKAPAAPDENDTVDLENPDQASGIQIEDEGGDTQYPVEYPSTPEEGDDGTQTPAGASDLPWSAESTSGEAQAVVANADGGAGSATGVSASWPGAGTQAQTVAARSASGSRPDANYKTGAGLGNDIYLIGAAAFGVVTLVLVVRKRRDKES